jgi:hypothetical protein
MKNNIKPLHVVYMSPHSVPHTPAKCKYKSLIKIIQPLQETDPPTKTKQNKNTNLKMINKKIELLFIQTIQFSSKAKATHHTQQLR